MKTYSGKQFYFSKCPQSIDFSFFFRPLKIFDTAFVSYPPFSFPVCSPCLLQQRPWGSRLELSLLPCPGGTEAAQPEGQGGSRLPATHPPPVQPQPLLCRGPRACSFPSCPWKFSCSKAQCIKLARCLTAQKGFSSSSFSAETIGSKFHVVFHIYHNNLKKIY